MSRAFYDENGYVLVPGVFSAAEMDVLETDFDRIVAQLVSSGENVNAAWGGEEVEKLGAQNSVVIHTHNVQHYSANWMRALLHENFVLATQELLGPNIVLHHSKLFQKPAEEGAPFPMHQDWNYFPFAKDSMLAAIIHVSDADDAMGCLRVYPGSHKLGRLTGAMGSDALDGYAIENATPQPAKRGDVLFFNYLTIHGSMPNRSDRTRKTVLVQMHAGDDFPEPGYPHPYERLCLSGWNSKASRSTSNEK